MIALISVPEEVYHHKKESKDLHCKLFKKTIKEHCKIRLATKYFHTHAQSWSKSMTLPSEDPSFDLETNAR
jgi:hypothetical protein